MRWNSREITEANLICQCFASEMQHIIVQKIR